MNGLDDPLTLMLLGLGTGILGNNKPGGNPFAGGMQGAMSGLMLGQQARTRREEQATNRELKELQARKLQFEMDEAARQRADTQDFISKVIAAQGQGGGAVSTAPMPGGAGTSDQAAIGGIESNGQPNGGYGAIGPPANDKGNRAYGKYQVMDFNIGPWTQEVLGKAMTPQEFLANPQAQDAVFNHKFNQYKQKYGDIGASRAWFAGEGGMNNHNARDVNGMTVQRYGDQYARNRGMPPVGPSGAGPTLTGLPAFQGPGMGAVQPGALPPGVQPRVNLPPTATPAQVAQGGDVPGVLPGTPADGSGNPLPPRQPQPAPQQPRGFNLTQELIMKGAANPKTKPLLDTMMTFENQRRTQANSERDYNLKLTEAQRAQKQWEERFNYDKGKDTREVDEKAKAQTYKQTQDVLQGEAKLRDDYRSEPVVKSYRTVVPMLEAAKDAATRPTRAADINLVYAFAKIMDPDSVVRESETGMAIQSGTIGDRLNGILGQLNGGQMLQPETRQRLIAELQSRFVSLEDSYNTVSGVYKGISERAGFNPENVIIPIRTGNERRPSTGNSNEPSQEELQRWAGGNNGQPATKRFKYVNGALVPE